MIFWQVIGLSLLNKFCWWRIKSVDEVVKVFDKVIEDLEQVQQMNFNKMANNNRKITKLREQNDIHMIEASRSQKVRENLTKLIG